MDKKTVMITGSSTGFGHATAKLFADKGWNVVATMRDDSAAGDLAGRDSVLVCRLDVTDPSSINQAIKTSSMCFGRLDAVINNAGYGQYGIFETVPQESIQRNFDVNVFGVMNVIRAVVPVFREEGEGLILNVSSCGGLVGLPSISIYLSTKFALEGFTESLSYELASQNVVVKMVEPGGGDTAFHARASRLNTGDGGLASYAPFLERANAALGKLAKGMATPQRIATVIYGAVTDGTKRLRYFAGDDVKQLVDAHSSNGRRTDTSRELFIIRAANALGPTVEKRQSQFPSITASASSRTFSRSKPPTGLFCPRPLGDAKASGDFAKQQSEFHTPSSVGAKVGTFARLNR